MKTNLVTLFLYDLFMSYKSRNVKKYIFVATTGRSGTKSLCDIFYQSQNIKALHEPYPAMLNTTMRSDYHNLQNKLIKSINIKRSAVNYEYYIETNHQFIKRFYDIAINKFKHKLGIIHLIRDPVEVAMSLYAIGSIPGETFNGKKYLLDPYSDSNIIKYSTVKSGKKINNNFHKCLWYWYETEERIKHIKNIYNDIKWYTLHTYELNDINKINKMLHHFNLYNVYIDKISHSNKKNHTKKTYLDKNEAEEIHKLFKYKLVEHNIFK